MGECKIFVDFVRENAKKNMVVCEVGCHMAGTTEFFAPIVKEHEGQVIVVDWFCGNLGSNLSYKNCGYEPHNADLMYQGFVDAMKKIDCLDITTIIRESSTVGATKIPDKSLDICFIDADHTYKHVFEDIHSYLPKVKSGGVLCGHDMEDINLANTFTEAELNSDYVNGRHCGVIQAVYDVFGTNIEVRPDYPPPVGRAVPIWIKRID